MMAARLVYAWSMLSLACCATGDRYPNCASGPLSQNDVCDMGLEPAERARALVAAMTMEEKLVNLVECV